MSLVGYIRLGKGPVWQWFADHFPKTAPVATAANRELRGGSGKEPCAVPLTPGADAALVGTAVGYVLAAYLRDDGIDSTVAVHGAAILDRVLRCQEPLPSVTERTVVARVRELSPARSAPGGESWEELLRLCVILARMEQMYRAGASVACQVMPPLVEHGGDLAELGRAYASEETFADLDLLARVTIEDLAELAEAELHLDPTFSQSAALGGADVDIIAGDTLLELKSGSGARVAGRPELWQLLGYLLADTEDAYGIERCSVLALRRRRPCTWEAQELIDALAGGPAAPVEQWRADFERMLRPVVEASERRRAELRSRREATPNAPQ